MNDTGKTVASRSVYVGEHVEKTGQSTAPVTTARKNGFQIFCALSSLLLDLENCNTSPIRDHTCGNI